MIERRPFDRLGPCQPRLAERASSFSSPTTMIRSARTGAACGSGTMTRSSPAAASPPHPHRDMEIITGVREGAITHQDSLGNKGRTEAGDVQVMSAGTGIVHSEYNLEAETTRIFQIWIIPTAAATNRAGAPNRSRRPSATVVSSPRQRRRAGQRSAAHPRRRRGRRGDPEGRPERRVRPGKRSPRLPGAGPPAASRSTACAPRPAMAWRYATNRPLKVTALEDSEVLLVEVARSDSPRPHGRGAAFVAPQPSRRSGVIRRNASGPADWVLPSSRFALTLPPEEFERLRHA